MKTFAPWFTAALIVSAIPSCKKEEVSDRKSTNTKLSNVVVLTMTKPKPTVELFDYHYDTLNRVTEIIYSTNSSEVSINKKLGPTYGGTKKWFYKGDDQKPYKSTGFIASDPNAEMYFFYDSNGNLVTDSLVPGNCNCYTIRKYRWPEPETLNSTTILVNRTDGTSRIIGRDSIHIHHNNLEYLYYENYPTIIGIIYNDGVNPINTLNIHAAIPLTQIGGVPTPGYCKNNRMTLIPGSRNTNSFSTWAFSDAIEYRYKYNAANMPVDCVIRTIKDSTVIKFSYSN